MLECKNVRMFSLLKIDFLRHLIGIFDQLCLCVLMRVYVCMYTGICKKSKGGCGSRFGTECLGNKVD